MDYDDLALGLFVGFFVGFFFLAGIALFDAEDGEVSIGDGVFVRVSAEQEEIDSSLKPELNLVEDNLDYCKSALVEEKEVAKELWDDYWDCLVIIWCKDDVDSCSEIYYDFSPDEIQSDLDFKELNCYYAENYDKYFERYE